MANSSSNANSGKLIMPYRRMGKSGLSMSALSFGSWVTFKNQLDLFKAQELIRVAFDNGVNFFDNAEVYANGESERIMGQAFKNLGIPRDEYIVSSKVFMGGDKPTQRGLHRKHVVEACHGAMKRLQVDYLDLYYCHRPDPNTPIEETVLVMNDLIKQGKVFYWGTSEWSAQQIEEAHQIANHWRLIGPSVEQPEYNLFAREKVEKEFLPIFDKYGMGTTIWSPLASGILTGKYVNSIPQNSRANVPQYSWLKEKISGPEGQQKTQKIRKLLDLAVELDCKPSQLAIAWCLRNKNVSTVILGATNTEQLFENLNSIQVYQKLNAYIFNQIKKIFD